MIRENPCDPWQKILFSVASINLYDNQKHLHRRELVSIMGMVHMTKDSGLLMSGNQ